MEPWRVLARKGEMLVAAPVEGDGGQTLGAVLVVARLPNLTGPLFVVTAVGALAPAFPRRFSA